jgi:hypothetical protein
MKNKLLIKLRKRFILCVRNKEYKVIDNLQRQERNSQIGTLWMSKEKALNERRRLILEAAQEFKFIKKILND